MASDCGKAETGSPRVTEKEFVSWPWPICSLHPVVSRFVISLSDSLSVVLNPLATYQIDSLLLARRSGCQLYWHGSLSEARC